MNPRVLVAEDSSPMRKIILRSLSSIGVQDTVEAADGEECLSLFASDDFDVILADWNMPKKSGLDIVREIQAAEKNVPVIVISTEAEKSAVLEAFGESLPNYLIKPFTPNELRDKLANCGY